MGLLHHRAVFLRSAPHSLILGDIPHFLVSLFADFPLQVSHKMKFFLFFFLFFCIISNHSLSFAKFILFCEGFDCYRKIGFIIFYFLPSSTIIPLFIPHVLLFYSFLLVALTTPFASYIDHCSFPFDRSTEALPRTHKEWCSSLPLGSVSLSVFLFLLLSLSFSFFMTIALSDSIPLILFISS